MLTFAEAKAKIGNIPLERTEISLRLDQTYGCVLSKPVVALQALPAWSNAAMDGYVLHIEDIQAATQETPIPLPVHQIIQAGCTQITPLPRGMCARIFTGAPIPPGANVVVMQEDVHTDKDCVYFKEIPKHGENIRQKGEEAEQGDILLKAGTRLDASSIGLCVASGVQHVWVWKAPRIGILSTGDELVEAFSQATLSTGQIWGSNSLNLLLALKELPVIGIECGIARDTLESTRERFIHALTVENCDMLISTGGVSVGDFDVVHRALADLPGFQVEMNFWNVKMKPGKPIAVGQITTPTKTIPLFALPGNPVSALMGYYQFVRPYLLQQLGVANTELQEIHVSLGEDFSKRGTRLEFVRVWLRWENDVLRAYSTGSQSSAWMSSMADATALLPFPAEEQQLAKDTQVRVQLLPTFGKWPSDWRG